MSLETTAKPMTLVAERVDPSPAAVTVINQPPVFERLHALVRKGYVADIGADTGTETILLRHLGKAPDLVLHGNGVIEEFDGRRPFHKRKIEALPRIAADGDADHLSFMRFLDTVPRPSLRDRTRRWRRKYIYFPVVLVIVWGLCFAFTAMIMSL